jgi:leucyl-tRNA synthetase
MSSPARGMLEFKIDRTRAYVMHKGRLPKDANELVEWLDEYTEFLQRSLKLTESVLKEHMNSCTRPIIIPRQERRG